MFFLVWCLCLCVFDQRNCICSNDCGGGKWRIWRCETIKSHESHAVHTLKVLLWSWCRGMRNERWYFFWFAFMFDARLYSCF